MGNTMDMKIIKTTQIEKKEFDINCDNILEICENNQEEAFDILFGVLETFIKKYKIEELEGSKIFSFRNDGKKLFSAIYKLFYCAEMFEDLENEDSEEDLKELNEYKLFMNDIQYIIDNIESIDLKGETDFSIKCNKCVEYINKKHDDLIKLNETMQQLNQSLEKLANSLTSIN